MKIRNTYISRKYILAFVLFVVCQVLKFMGRIADPWWAMVSIGGVLGYQYVNVWQKNIDKECLGDYDKLVSKKKEG